MKITDVHEGVGRIVPGINTTKDVGINEISKQAKKFGNTVDNDGRPPVIAGSPSHKLYNMGLVESTDLSDHIVHTVDEAAYSGNIGAMEVMQFFMRSRKEGTTLYDYVKKLSDSSDAAANKLAWAIIQDYMGVKLVGDQFGGNDAD